jgi:hypothetical protein
MSVKKWRKDFAAYAKDVLQIQTKKGKIEPFVLNRFQRRLDAIVEEEIAKPKGARIILLKARQLGSSTYIAGRQYHRTTLWPNQTALTLAHDLDTAEALHRKPLLFWNMSGPNVRPERKLSNRRELQFSKDDEAGTGDVGLQSRIQIATAKDSHAGIGLTIHALHLSEAARYESVTRDAQDLFIGMMQAVPEEPGTMVVLETTAFGLGWFYELWNDRSSGWRKVFVSWLSTEEYTHDDPLAPSELEGAEQTRYGNEQALLPIVEAELREWYPELYPDDRPGTAESLRIEALCRLRWRREKIDIAFGGDKDRFKQEYPSTPEEAFLTTGNLVFDGRKLADYKHAIEMSDSAPATYRYDLQEDRFYQAPYGGLRVYEAPDPQGRYVIGADVGEGLHDKDFSAAQVLRVPELTQVAVLQDRIDPAAFAEQLAALGMWYNQAFIGVEVNGPGFATNLHLAQHLWYPMVYTRQSFDTKTKRYLKRTGWHTNKATKTVMITDFRKVVRDDILRLNDIETLDEMGWYQQDEKTGKMDAAPGYNDDLVMSMAIALQMVAEGNFGEIAVPDTKKQMREGSWKWYSKLLDREERRRNQWN